MNQYVEKDSKKNGVKEIIGKKIGLKGKWTNQRNKENGRKKNTMRLE
jgi:hypothetical protein